MPKEEPLEGVTEAIRDNKSTLDFGRPSTGLRSLSHMLCRLAHRRLEIVDRLRWLTNCSIGISFADLSLLRTRALGFKPGKRGHHEYQENSFPD